MTNILQSVSEGNIQQIREIIQQDESGELVNIRNNNGKTALHLAVEKGNLEITKLLIEFGRIDVNAVDEYGSTALHLAALYGNREIVELLIKNQASNTLLDNAGNAPFDIAVEWNNNEIARLLIEQNGNRKTDLHLAVEKGNLEITKLLIEFGEIDINAADENGSTALHLAALYGNREIVELLIKNQASHTLLDNAGNVPFEIAVEWDNIEIAEILAELNEVDLNAKDNEISNIKNLSEENKDQIITTKDDTSGFANWQDVQIFVGLLAYLGSIYTASYMDLLPENTVKYMLPIAGTGIAAASYGINKISNFVDRYQMSSNHTTQNCR